MIMGYMSAEDWATRLQKLVQKGGGTTQNGWTVDIKIQPSGKAIA